jgi:hypothetical protein
MPIMEHAKAQRIELRPADVEQVVGGAKLHIRDREYRLETSARDALANTEASSRRSCARARGSPRRAGGRTRCAGRRSSRRPDIPRINDDRMRTPERIVAKLRQAGVLVCHAAVGDPGMDVGQPRIRRGGRRRSRPDAVPIPGPCLLA